MRRPLAPATLLVLLAALTAGPALALAFLDPARGWGGILAAALFGVSLPLGSGAFVAITWLSGARWWDDIRPVPGALLAILAAPASLLALGLVLNLVLGLGNLYPWAGADGAPADSVVEAKAAWLNPSLFLARAGLILVAWFWILTALARGLRRLEQFAGEAEANPRGAMDRASVCFLLVFAPTLSVAFWDWGMSLEPAWFSSLYGVYAFGGVFRAGIALIIVASVLWGFALSSRQAHFLGTLLFAFSMFWAYLWISQYLLIWYADLPEESLHYLHRLQGDWSLLFWLNPILGFVVPFAVLLPSWTKKNPWILKQVAISVLVAHWLDMFLLVAPAQGPFTWAPVLSGLLATLALLAIMLVQARRSLDRWPSRREETGSPTAAESLQEEGRGSMFPLLGES